MNFYRITIFHQIGRDRFFEATDKSVFEIAYSYVVNAKPDLDTVFHTNNTLDDSGSDYSFKNKARSLSVGDGFIIRHLNDGTAIEEAHVVQNAGFRSVSVPFLDDPEFGQHDGTPGPARLSAVLIGGF